jgi:hypothetical protein
MIEKLTCLSDKYTREMVTTLQLKLSFALSILVGILSIAGLAVLIFLWQTKLTPFKDYAVVVDAGSTHSKIFLYT